MDRVFEDRRDAGRQLAEVLTGYRHTADLLVLALPRGGVPVAYEVAHTLNAELDILVVRKLGVPHQPELAMGAITSGGGAVFNDDVIRLLGITPAQVESAIDREQDELEWREHKYRGDREKPHIEGRTLIVIDDGVATGASMQAALKALRSLHPSHLAVAVPTGSRESVRQLEALADNCVCLLTPAAFYAVGQWYRDFTQVTDEAVRELLLLTQQEKTMREQKAKHDGNRRHDTLA